MLFQRGLNASKLALYFVFFSISLLEPINFLQMDEAILNGMFERNSVAILQPGRYQMQNTQTGFSISHWKQSRFLPLSLYLNSCTFLGFIGPHNKCKSQFNSFHTLSINVIGLYFMLKCIANHKITNANGESFLVLQLTKKKHFQKLLAMTKCSLSPFL